MAWRESASLIQAMAASLALHVGAAAVLDAALGGAGSGPGRHAAPAGSAVLLHVTLAGSTLGPVAPLPAATVPTYDLEGAARRGLIDPPLPQYFPVDELDRKPQVIDAVPLDYPAQMPLVARSRIVLSLLIDEQGRVDKVIVEAADAPPELEDLASRAFADARFSPGLRGGVAVKSRLRVEVTFEGE